MPLFTRLVSLYIVIGNNNGAFGKWCSRFTKGVRSVYCEGICAMIRKAEKKDISRIAEILVFVKRIKYRPIFQNDDYSFGELQVIRVSQEYDKPEILNHMWVYDDGIVKGLIHITGEEVVELYVDYFFWGQGVGSKLLEFAKEKFGVSFLWTLEKNIDAIRFYEAHGFHDSGERKPEEGTAEYLIKMAN